MEKVTAGREELGTFAPKFAQLNDDVLFGEVWSREDQLSARDRSIVTVTALMASGILDGSLKFHIQNGRDYNACCILCRMAESMGCIQNGERNLGGSINEKGIDSFSKSEKGRQFRHTL